MKKEKFMKVDKDIEKLTNLKSLFKRITVK